MLLHLVNGTREVVNVINIMIHLRPGKDLDLLGIPRGIGFYITWYIPDYFPTTPLLSSCTTKLSSFPSSIMSNTLEHLQKKYIKETKKLKYFCEIKIMMGDSIQSNQLYTRIVYIVMSTIENNISRRSGKCNQEGNEKIIQLWRKFNLECLFTTQGLLRVIIKRWSIASS